MASALRDEPRGIAVSNGFVFWSLATGLHRPGSIVVDDGGVWVAAAGPSEAPNGYLARCAGTISWLPHAGGIPPRAIAEGQEHPTALAVDAEGVYWTNLLGGTVMRATRVSP